LLLLEEVDSLFLEINTIQCDQNHPLKACPINGSKRRALRVRYDFRVHINFGSERNFNRYAKKIQKQAYRSWVINGEECLIDVYDTKQDSILQGTGICDQFFFCKKHKVVYQ
jgi:hypothetical protein